MGCFLTESTILSARHSLQWGAFRYVCGKSMRRNDLASVTIFIVANNLSFVWYRRWDQSRLCEETSVAQREWPSLGVPCSMFMKHKLQPRLIHNCSTISVSLSRFEGRAKKWIMYKHACDYVVYRFCMVLYHEAFLGALNMDKSFTMNGTVDSY